MGRKRSKELAWLPKDCSRSKGQLVYRPYKGKGKGFGKQIPIMKDDPERKYSTSFRFEFHEKLRQVIGRSTNRDLRWLVDQYTSSRHFREELKPSTQDNYHSYTHLILDKTMKHRMLGDIQFGDIPVTKITRPIVRKYMDAYPAKVAANRHLQFLKAVFAWAMERYPEIQTNPTDGVKQFKEIPRDRYIADWEFAVVYQCARSMPVPIMAAAMQLSYLQRARRGEVFALTTHDVKDSGIFLERGKGSVNEITAWSENMREALELCKSIYPDARPHPKGPYLLHNQYGNPYATSAINSAWKRVMSKAFNSGAKLEGELLIEAKQAGAVIEDGNVRLKDSFTFHDIKAKGVSDHGSHHSGHLTKKMLAVYQRVPDIIEPTR